jgi:hypothetical protein
MKRVVVGAAAAIGTGMAVARWLAARGRMPAPVRDPMASRRWLAVTINCRPEDIRSDGRLPEPLVGLDIEVRIDSAPGDRGTELYARPRQPVPTGAAGVLARLRGEDPRQRVRKALRDTKSIIETGEVLQPDTPFATSPTTLPGRLVDLAVGRAPGEGRL